MNTISDSGPLPITQVDKPPVLRRSLALMKPITWFGPMWAFLCGAIASGGASWTLPDVGRLFIGILMAGPILCGLSQVINDYFDREVDALNEPHRLIPSGMVSPAQILITVLVLLASGTLMAIYLGQQVALFVGVGIVFAFIYSAPPFRAKRNGWVGNALVAISYEGLAWMAGHGAFGTLTTVSLILALLYSFGAHGIMSINDFKSMAGDKLSGIRSIPVMYGPNVAAKLIILTMNLAQIGVILSLFAWGRPLAASINTLLLLIQIPLQRSFLRDPIENHIKFSAIGVNFFVWGMLVAALAVRTIL